MRMPWQHAPRPKPQELTARTREIVTEVEDVTSKIKSAAQAVMERIEQEHRHGAV